MGTHSAYPPRTPTSPPPPWSDCHLSHVEVVARHGTRYPTARWITLCLSLERLTAAPLAPPWLRAWSCPFLPPSAGELAAPGMRELHLQGGRLRGALGGGTGWDLTLAATAKTRTTQSASSFALGLMSGHEGGLGGEGVLPWPLIVAPLDQDRLLRFFDLCPGLEGQLAQEREPELFGATLLPPLAHKLSQRLGVEGGPATPTRPLTSEEARAAWELCAFQLALNSSGAGEAWCSLFLEDEALELEWLEELETFYENGPGTPLVARAACPLLTTLLGGLQSASRRDPTSALNASAPASPLRVSVRVGHAETLLPLLALLGHGAGQEEADLMRANTSHLLRARRTWRSSALAPFGGNLQLMLYACPKDPLPWRVRARLQEVDWVLPGCAEPCDLRTLLRLHAPDQCAFDAECSVPPPPSPQPPPLPLPLEQGSSSVWPFVSAGLGLLVLILGALSMGLFFRLRALSRPPGPTFTAIPGEALEVNLELEPQ